MAARQTQPSSPLRVLEEALGMGLTSVGDAADAADAEAAEGAYYLEQVTITETSEDDYEYEEIPDDNVSVPEGEEDLARALQLVQEQTTDTQILEQETVLPSRHAGPEVIEDFLCNFLIKMGMTRTLDCFQSEWLKNLHRSQDMTFKRRLKTKASPKRTAAVPDNNEDLSSSSDENSRVPSGRNSHNRAAPGKSVPAIFASCCLLCGVGSNRRVGLLCPELCCLSSAGCSYLS